MKILLTQGEPLGIGPEIALKAMAEFAPPEGVEVVLVGNPDELRRVGSALRLPVPREVIPVSGPSLALAALEEAARLVAAGEAHAVTTAPVNKARLRDAGFPFPGQTEFFTERFGAKKSVMMLAAGGLRCVPATIHVGLAEVPRLLTAEKLDETLRLTHAALRRDFAIPDPRIAVLGINPHAGEEGLFGDEEGRVFAPVLARARADGLRVEGPLPGDATFAPRSRARFDAIVGAYHDQALGPFKALAGGTGVNVTLGLPAIRTSPDHGTAEDIAGKGIGDPVSLIAALDLAVAMAGNRARYDAADAGEKLWGPGIGP
ncbi:MAG: 4-hydroxythreonine-4-phosphate dehydrogenase PdxA [Planctomycetota bacterium]